MKKYFKYLIIRTFKSYPFPKMVNILEESKQNDFVFTFIAQGQPGGQREEFWTVGTTHGRSENWVALWPGLRASGPGWRGFYSTIECPVASSPAKLLSLLEEFCFWSMSGSTGGARDGIHYKICFLSRSISKCVKIWNPSCNSSEKFFCEKLHKYYRQFHV